MFRKPAGNSVALPPQVNRKPLDHPACEIAREVYQTIASSGLDKFTFSLIDALWQDLNAVVQELERLPEAAFKDLIGVIDRLASARNELRLARFLFNLEEIDAVRCLVMRNKAVLRGKLILQKALRAWPSQSAPEGAQSPI